MQYAILSPADQTFVYETGNDSYTTKHPEAKLWDDKLDCEAYCKQLNKEIVEANVGNQHMEKLLSFGDWYVIEEVVNEVEFRSRKDTW